MRRQYLPIIFALFCIWLFSPTVTGAQSSEEEIQRDMDILQNVLGKLLNGKSSSFSGSRAHSAYLPGYGIIFNVKYASHVRFLVTPRPGKKDVIPASSGYAVESDLFLSLSKDDSAMTEKKDKIIDELKKNLARFYTDYASGARSLPENETITVIVDLGGEESFLLFPAQGPQGGGQLSVSVAKSRLPQLRQSTNPAGLIQFDISNSRKSIDDEMDIFCDLLNETLAGTNRMADFNKSCRAMYIPGFGSVLMLRTSLALDHELGIIESGDVTAYVAAADDHAKEWKEKSKKRYRQIKEDLIDLVARYGGSLRSLKATENLFITLETDDRYGSERATGLTLLARMADVQKAFTGELGAQAFKNTLKIHELKQ